MAYKLRKTLFVGLGGTGLETLLHVKRRFVETYEEIPPMFGFLAVDTDNTTGGLDRTKTTSMKKHPKVGFDATEKCAITVSNPEDIYKRQKEDFFWMHEKNIDKLRHLENGAGQVRTNGRFGLLCNIPQFKEALQRQLATINNQNIANNPKYKILNQEDIDIYVVASIAGGTGCGTFLDIGYLIKDTVAKIQGKYKTYAYLIMPQVYKQEIGLSSNSPKSANINPNAYGALIDTDFLMHVGYNNPIQLVTPEKTLTCDYPPYDLISLIDNRNKLGQNFDHINQLEEMAAIGLTLSVSDFANSKSLWDNILTFMVGGSMDVNDKKAWASGMSVCEITVDGNGLANIYANRLSARIIDGLLNTCDDTSRIANNWIDAPNINIRENDGDIHNNLIDQILEANPPYSFSGVSDPKSPQASVDLYIEEFKKTKEDLSKKTEAIFNTVSLSLKEDLIIKQINKDCGIGNIKGVLEELERQVSIFLSEMTNEIEEHQNNKIRIKTDIEASINGLSEIANSMNPFRKANRIAEAEEVLGQVVTQDVINEREILRKQEAKKFFGRLLDLIISNKERIISLVDKLNRIRTDLRNQAALLANEKQGIDRAFVINLKEQYANTVSVNDNDIDIYAFIKQLSKGTINGLYDFLSMDEELIKEYFWKVAKDHKKALEWRNINIEDIISKMEPKEQDNLFEKAVQKSNPLLTFDYRGYVINPIFTEIISIGLPDINNSLVKEKKLIEKTINTKEPIDYTSTNMKDRIIIYRVIASAPAFAIPAFDTCKLEYETKKSEHFFHINTDWYNIMDRDNYNIYPIEEKDESKIEFWVQGILHGFIENRDGVYRIKSEKNGDPIDDYWYELSRTEYRDEAYDAFARDFKTYKDELETKITNEIDRMGKEQYNLFLEKVKSPSAYLNHFSQLNVEASKLKTGRAYKRTAKLIRDEIDFITNSLN